MALEKVIETDRIEVIYPNGEAQLQVRTKTVILEDGVEISSKFHREVMTDDSDFSNACDRCRDIARAVLPSHVDLPPQAQA